jgi:hypothetical protein
LFPILLRKDPVPLLHICGERIQVIANYSAHVFGIRELSHEFTNLSIKRLM